MSEAVKYTYDWDNDEFAPYDEPMVDVITNDSKRSNYFSQYGIEEGTKFRPASNTIGTLPAGYYKPQADNYGLYFDMQKVHTSELIRFPDSVSDSIIDEFDTFWEKKEAYREHGEHHKRGFLLWGPPGGGKTCTASLLIKDFITSGNVVMEFTPMIIESMRAFRAVEPERKLMVVIEDIDSYVRYPDIEQILLQFLDGEIQHTNTIIVATTNYPEQLPDRLINRPSRFDRVSYLGLPSVEDRDLYLQTKSKTLKPQQIRTWVNDTEGFTLAHLKELIIAVEVFDLDYDETIERLNKMRSRDTNSDQYVDELRGEDKANGNDWYKTDDAI